MTHRVYFYSHNCAALSQCEHIYGLHVSHMSRNLLQSVFSVLFCSLQRHICELTCAVTPPEPHMFQLGQLHSVPHSKEATSRAAEDRRTQSTHWIMRPVATELMLFLKKLKPSAKVFSTHPHPLEPSLFTPHVTYDSSSLGLSFNVCQGQSSQRTHMAREKLHSEGASTSAKVAKKVIAVAHRERHSLLQTTISHRACLVQ